METANKTRKELLSEIESLTLQLEEANDSIEAIRSGNIDALVVQGENGHELYTLKSADHTYRIFIEKMSEGAVTLNKDGIIEYCNSSFAIMLDLSLSKVIGLPFTDFIELESLKIFENLFLQSWKIDNKGEVWLKGRELIPVQLSLATMEIDYRQTLSIIVSDLKSQKQTQNQLSEYNKQLEVSNHALAESNHDLQQFASVASHDLQEPVRKIQIFSQRLKEKYEKTLSDEAGKYLTKIIDSAGRMKTLIFDILTYSKLSDKTKKFEVIDLTLLIQDVVSDFDLVIHEKNATVTIEKLISIEANKGQIRQVFQNIISNALKFANPALPPQIEIHCKQIRTKSFDSPGQKDGPYCLISISDNGIGFDEKFSETIFSLFERLNAKDKFEGTGIGLSITKKIIEKHAGLIEARSGIGIGSTFNIILPVLQK